MMIKEWKEEGQVWIHIVQGIDKVWAQHSIILSSLWIWSFQKYFQKEIEPFSITSDREENYLNILLPKEEASNCTIFSKV